MRLLRRIMQYTEGLPSRPCLRELRSNLANWYQKARKRFTLLAAVYVALAASVCSVTPEPKGPPIRTWAVSYGPVVPQQVPGLDLLVVESMHYSSASQLRTGRKPPTLIAAYLSLGEISDESYLLKNSFTRKILVERNESWPSWRVDLRSEHWQQLVINTLAKAIERKGFDALFLDTIAVPLLLEARDPDHYAGSVAALRAILTGLRRTYPQMVLIGNGLETVDAIHDLVDVIVVESLFGGFDATSLQPRVSRTAMQRLELIKQAERAQHTYHLTVLGLDYLGPDATAARVEPLYRALNIRPYFAHPHLLRVESVNSPKR